MFPGLREVRQPHRSARPGRRDAMTRTTSPLGRSRTGQLDGDAVGLVGRTMPAFPTEWPPLSPGTRYARSVWQKALPLACRRTYRSSRLFTAVKSRALRGWLGGRSLPVSGPVRLGRCARSMARRSAGNDEAVSSGSSGGLAGPPGDSAGPTEPCRSFTAVKSSALPQGPLRRALWKRPCRHSNARVGQLGFSVPGAASAWPDTSMAAAMNGLVT